MSRKTVERIINVSEKQFNYFTKLLKARSLDEITIALTIKHYVFLIIEKMCYYLQYHFRIYIYTHTRASI